MGEQDIEKLMEIYTHLTNFCKTNNFNFKFKVDQGNFETAIEFMGNGHSHPPISSNWTALQKNGHAVICPDLLDYRNKIVIEYEEEPKPMKGPKIIKKGHTEESKKDTDRDNFYEQGKFKLFKIWEFDDDWRRHLDKFILQCYEDV